MPPGAPTLRKLARHQTKRVNTLKMEGLWGDAAQTGLDTVQMGGDVARGAWILPKLVGSAMIAIGVVPLVDSDDLPGHLSAGDARAATRRLEHLMATMPTYRDAAKEERWFSLTLFLNLTKQPNWRASADQGNGFSDEAVTWRDKLTVRLITKREIVHRINEQFDLLDRELTNPYSKPSDLTPKNTDIISQQFATLISMRRSDARELVSLRILLLRFALQAFKAEHGTYPTTLNQLAPAYIKQVPTDYYADEKPFHYQSMGKTYKLWSVGPDGVDNGGTPISVTQAPRYPGEPPHPAVVSPDSKGDWVAGKNR